MIDNSCQDCGVDLHPGLCGVCYIKRMREEIKLFRDALELCFNYPCCKDLAQKTLDASYFNDKGEIKNEA